METPQTPRTDAAPTDPPKPQPEPGSALPLSLLRYLRALANRVIQLGGEIKQSRQDLLSLETALVARIADVDDERRRGELRLRRVLKSQRSELEVRLRQQASLLGLTLLLVTLLLGGGLLFALFKLQSAQQSFESEIGELKQAMARLGAATQPMTDPQLRAQIERLSLAVAEISRALEAQRPKAPPAELDLKLEPQAPSPAPAEISAQATQETGDPSSAVAEPAPAPIQVEAAEPPPGPIEPEVQVASTQAAEQLQAAPSEIERPAADGSQAVAQTAAPASEGAADQDKTQRAAEGAGDEAEQSGALGAPLPEALPAEGAASEGPAQEPPLPRRIQVGDRPFSLQLVGFHSLQALERFVADNPVPMVYYYREETYQGRPWFVLIHSLHASREEAEAAVASLPPKLARLNLWIRRLKPETEVIEVQRPAP